MSEDLLGDGLILVRTPNSVLASTTDTEEEAQAASGGRTTTGDAAEAPDAQAEFRETGAAGDADEEMDTDQGYVTVPSPLPAPQLDAVNDDGEPLFKNYEEYLAAHAEWTMAEGARRLEARQVTRQTHEAINARHTEAVTSFKRTHTDFDAALRSAKPTVAKLQKDLGPDALGVIDRYTTSDADNGPAIIYHLAQHPEELKRIARLPPPLQLAALGKLDAVVDGGGGSGSRRRSAESETYEQYKTRRNKEERDRRR